MSLLSLKKIKLGDNADTSKNFVISVPAVADGTLTIERENGTDVLTIDANGFVGLADGPKIKTKKFSGTTAATVSTNVGIAHGLSDITKVLSIVGRVNTGANILPMDYADPTQLVSPFTDTTNVYARTGPSAGAAVLSKPFTIVVTYEA